MWRARARRIVSDFFGDNFDEKDSPASFAIQCCYETGDYIVRYGPNGEHRLRDERRK